MRGNMYRRINFALKCGASAAAMSAALLAGGEALAQDQVETVVVTGYRASLQNAIDLKRDQTAAVDSIVAEDVGKFPDSNLAEAMQRIPGVVLGRGDGGEGRNITVRGLGAQFTRVRLNGMEGASQTGASDIYGAGNGGRSFDFNVFPTEIFSSLSARKTTSPNVEEGSLGATVDLQVPRPFDYHDDLIVSGTARMTYQEVGEQTGPRGSLLVSKKFGDKFGVLASISYQKRNTLEVGYAAVDILRSSNYGGFCSPLGYTGTQNPVTNAAKGTDAANCSTGNPRTSSLAAYEKIMAATGDSGVAGGGVFLPRIPRYVHSEAETDRRGATLTFQWLPDADTDVDLDLLYTRTGTRRVDSYIGAISFGRAVSNNGFPMMSVTDIDFKSNGSLVYGAFNGVDVRSENLDDRFASTAKQAALSVKRNFTQRFKMDAYLGYYENVYNAPWRFQTVIDAIDTDNFSIDLRKNKQHPVISFGIDVSDPTNFSYAPASNGNVTGFFNNQGKPMRNTSVNEKAEINADYQILDALAIKAGMSYRVNNFSSWYLGVIPSQQTTLALPSGYTLANLVKHVTGSDKYWSGAPSDWVQMDQQKFLKAFNYHFTYCGTECGAGASQIRETLKSAYLMADFNTSLLGFPVRGDAGFRYVHTGEDAVGTISTTPTAAYIAATGYTSIGVRNEVSRAYHDWLPSGNIVVEPADDMLVRISAAKVMTRPELGYLIPSSGVNATTRTGTINNPYLKPIRANTVDVAYEYYFHPGSLFSVAYFHKDIKTYIQKINSYMAFSELGLPASLLDNSQSTVDDQFYVARYENTKGGPLDGVEFSVQTPLWFLPGFWSNFGVQATYTYVQSRINYILTSSNGVATSTTKDNMLGLSPNSASGVVYYEDSDFSIRMTGNFRSGYIRGIPASDGSDIQGNRSTFYLDASASYALTDSVKLVIEAQNLTDEMNVLYVDSQRKDTLFALRDGRSVTIGFNFKL